MIYRSVVAEKVNNLVISYLFRNHQGFCKVIYNNVLLFLSSFNALFSNIIFNVDCSMATKPITFIF